MSSHFDKYREELNKVNLTTERDLENIVRPLIKKATRLIVNRPSRPPENSQHISQFGGDPYFEINNEWPHSRNGNPLTFIFQVFNEVDIALPDHIALIQLFYDFDEFPWDTEDDGWLVKVFTQLNKDSVIHIRKPEALSKSKYCEISFQNIESLPDWEGIDSFCKFSSNLSCVLNEDEPWGHYQTTVEKLIGEQDFQSQLCGYPKFVQGNCIPTDNNGKPYDLLFQIDSEDNAGLMWGDTGQIYVFADSNHSQNIEFSLQCL